MSSNIVQEITAKASALPLDKQREVLDFVEFILHKGSGDFQQGAKPRKPFQTMEGIIPRQIENLERDLTEVRREMWQNFPREEPK
jgi:hypothetical protein